MQVSIYIPSRLLALVDLHAKRRSISRSALIAQAMRELVGDTTVSPVASESEREVAAGGG